MKTLLGIAISAVLSLTPVGSSPPEKDYVGTVTISAYSVNEGGGENYYTASGATPKAYKTIATSSDYPFGTKLYIEGIGECVVEDRGGSLIQSGERIDLFIGEDDCEQFGLQERKVYLVEECTSY